MKKIINIILGKGFVIGVCILIQVLWFCGLIMKLTEYYIPLSLIINILALAMVLSVIVNRDNPAYKLVWTVVILVFPVFGVFLYAAVGSSDIPKRMNRNFNAINKRFEIYKAKDEEIIEELAEENPYIKNQCSYISNYSGFGIYKNTDVKYFPETDVALEELLTQLSNAKKYIFMEYFTIEDSVIWARIEDILEAKVKEGVEVRIIHDDFGCIGKFNSKFKKRLISKGIKVKTFNPLIPIIYVFMNNRDHRKITVIDGIISFNGGFNLCDEYFNVNCHYGYWKDTCVMLRGEAVKNHIIMFLQMWNSISDTDNNYDEFFKIEEYTAKDSDAIVAPFSDSPLDHECVGENVYLNIIRNAKDYVYIFTPYLIIDNEMMEELCLAAKSGIDVRIVTPGIPDKKIIYMLTKSYYPQLLEAGVRIYHYTPGFIHAKSYICDDEIGVVGTINMDYRSLYLHFECATYMYKVDALKDLKQDYLETFEKGEEVFLEVKTVRKSAISSLFKAVLRLFAPLM